MKITRRFTKPASRLTRPSSSAAPPPRSRTPTAPIVFRLDGFDVPEALEPGRRRHPRPEVFPQGRRRPPPEEGRRDAGPLWLWRSVPDERALAELPEGGALRRRDRRAPGLRPPRRHLDLLGLEGRLLLHRGGRAGVLRRAPLHAGHADGARRTSPQWFNTGLHWAYGIDGPGQGHFYVDLETGKLTVSDFGLRASAAARLLHPVGRGRSRQRERHHGPVGARGAPVQVRLGHRLQLLQAARRQREAVGRRQVVRPDELPQDRRPRRRRHQVGRHDAPRRQDGRRRRRSSRHRGIHQLEGERGAEGRRPRHRLEDLPEAPQGRDEGLRQLRGATATPASTRPRTRR